MGLRPLTGELIKLNYTAGAWRPEPLYVAVNRIAAKSPARVAVADQHDRLTYAELVRQSSALGGWLLESGLKPGDCVALQTWNRAAIALLHLACNRADLTFLPLSSGWQRSEIAHLLKASKAKVAIVPPPHRGVDFLSVITELRPGLDDLERVGVLGAEGGDFAVARITHLDRPPWGLPRDPNEGRFVMVTSGTTDLPRMSLWTDNNLWFFMQQYILATRMQAGDIAVGLAPASTGATGYVYPVLAPLLAGATSILLEEWDPAAALDLIEAERATIAVAVPTQVMKMLQEPSVTERDFSALQVFTNAGAVMPPDAARRMEEVFGCTSQVCYGATDGGVPVLTKLTDPPEKRYRTAGRLLPLTELRLVNARGRDVQKGAAGEIWWRNPTKSLGYLNDPERTAATFADGGWYRSGDLGQLDEDGYLSIVGRVKDVIIRGGQNISPGELEDALRQHPSISEVSVIGIPDSLLGERTCACVVLMPGASLSLPALVAFLAARDVATYKLPERLEILADLPKSVGGKTSKVELRRLMANRDESASPMNFPGPKLQKDELWRVLPWSAGWP